MGWIRQTVLFVAVLLSFHSSIACNEIKFITVEPLGTSFDGMDCASNRDTMFCKIHSAFQRFGRVKLSDGSTAMTVQGSISDISYTQNTVARIKNSAAIREILDVRIRARVASGYTPQCEPLLLYISKDPWAGFGPAFVDSEKFSLNGKVYKNLLSLEPSNFLPMIDELDSESLEKSGYFDIVVAHELVHGMMQDLYGIDAFSKLIGSSKSRGGHYASATSDPALAWSEGVAEAFEAYLGEKYFGKELSTTPYSDKFFGETLQKFESNQIELKSQNKFFAFFETLLKLPGTVYKLKNEILWIKDNMPNIVADILKSERQSPIRNNTYVLKGNYVNFMQKYHDFPMEYSEIDQILSTETEDSNAVLSKEGVVAHIVYSVLKAGKVDQFLTTVARHKPKNLAEFVNQYREDWMSEVGVEFETSGAGYI